MNNILEHEFSKLSRYYRRRLTTRLQRLLYFPLLATVITALAAGMILLVSDVFSLPLLHSPISAAPLLLIGATYLGFQIHVQPKPLDLVKALLVGAAFILWGVDQLLPAGWFATTLGDVVIVLYVVDLGWMMTDRLKRRV